jgi:hypothetical protein
VHLGILAQIDRRQMEAEDTDRTDQAAQAASGDQLGAVGDQRIDQYLQVGDDFFGSGVGFGDANGVFRRLVLVERAGGRCEARVDAGQRPPVGLVEALRRAVRRSFGERCEGVGNFDQGV